MDLYPPDQWGLTPPEEPDDAEESLLPRLTPLQFLVLWLLFGGPRSGRSLRVELEAWGAGMGRSAFSQLMTRLVAAGLVHSRFVTHDNFGRPIRFCLYQAREDALGAWRAARDFYANLKEPRDAEAGLFDESTEPDEDDELIDEFTNSLLADAHARRAREEQKRQENARRRPGRR
jgi:DNA-binding PadR family transcriptional regulator